ncbi:O-antigen ligase family protein [Neiella marina]|uniref:O-antigen ligase family protein n=1 Tax=Neiella holothuriorum TaxID=2870530 RepID=A0ABS7EKT6_9GAMM|nr:O-antigen ligase family protein [Neiella holothuriorum]MBW8192488.1 O-antigen ligase family protein [Neiella holothuriorum]
MNKSLISKSAEAVPNELSKIQARLPNSAPHVLGLGSGALLISLLVIVSCGWYWLPNPLVALALAVIPPATYLMLKYPFVMVLGFVLLSFFRLHELYPPLMALRLPQLFAIAAMVSMGWHLFVIRKMQMYWNADLSWLLGFFLLCALGVVLASNRGVAISYFNGVFSKIALMTLVIAWLLRKPNDFKQAAVAFVIAGALVALVALSNAAAGIEMVEGNRVTIGRSFGSTLGDPNDLALVLLFPLGFTVGFMCHAQGWRRITASCVFILLMMAILATQSRGGLLGVLTVVGVFGWRRVNNKAVLVILGLLALLVLFALAGIDQRSSGGAAEQGVDESAMGRIYAWQAAIAMAVHAPFTGVGLDNFYANYYFYSPHWDGKNHAVHSTWFGILAETGFVGLTVFVAIVWRMVRRIRSVVTAKVQSAAVQMVAESVLAGLLGTIVSGTFLTQGFTWPFYIFFALIVALKQSQHR